jgi:hypothetical protein
VIGRRLLAAHGFRNGERLADHSLLRVRHFMQLTQVDDAVTGGGITVRGIVLAACGLSLHDGGAERERRMGRAVWGPGRENTRDRASDRPQEAKEAGHLLLEEDDSGRLDVERPYCQSAAESISACSIF